MGKIVYEDWMNRISAEHFRLPEGELDDLARMQYLLDQAFAGATRLKVLTMNSEETRARVVFEKALANLSGLLHGGVLFTVGDTLTGLLLFYQEKLLDAGLRPVTAEASIRYLRSVVKGGVECVAHLRRREKNRAWLWVNFYDDEGNRVARGKYIYALIPE